MITITKFNTAQEIIHRLSKIQTTQNLKLPIVIQDNALYKYFPFELLSHVVWIGPDRRVKAITGTEHITEENILAMLNGKEINWPVKRDLLNFSQAKPILSFNNANISTSPLYYSALTGQIAGVDATTTFDFDTSKNILTINHYNIELFPLCIAAINGHFKDAIPNAKDCVFEVKDLGKFKMDLHKNYWTTNDVEENKYCYSLSVPLLSSENKIESLIRIDLSRWLKIVFGITVQKEKRIVDCLILKNIGSYKIPSSQGGRSDIHFENKVYRVTNYAFDEFVHFLNNNFKNIPFIIDETGISKATKINVIIDAKDKSLDVNWLNAVLSQYGLQVNLEKREREIIVIKEDLRDAN